MSADVVASYLTDWAAALRNSITAIKIWNTREILRLSDSHDFQLLKNSIAPIFHVSCSAVKVAALAVSQAAGSKRLFSTSTTQNGSL